MKGNGLKIIKPAVRASNAKRKPIRLTKAQRRAMYPEHMPMERCSPCVDVMLNMPADLYKKVAAIAGRNSFTGNVEEAIITCVRAMVGGDLPIIFVADIMAGERRVGIGEAMFGKRENLEEPERLLHEAAKAAGWDDFPDDAVPEMTEGEAMLAVSSGDDDCPF
jgi:hypothetical protein